MPRMSWQKGWTYFGASSPTERTKRSFNDEYSSGISLATYDTCINIYIALSLSELMFIEIDKDYVYIIRKENNIMVILLGILFSESQFQ